MSEIMFMQGSKEYDALVSKLKSLSNLMKEDEYNKILSAFCSGSLDIIADMLVSAYNDKKSALMDSIRISGDLKELEFDMELRNREIKDLKSTIIEKDMQIKDLKGSILEKDAQFHNLYCQSIGITPAEGMIMKAEYENGMSLRMLAEKYKCDKSTIKRRLIKMGVTIRE